MPVGRGVRLAGRFRTFGEGDGRLGYRPVVSISVSVVDVPTRLEEYGTAAFLVTVSPDGTSKVVHVAVVWDARTATFRCTPGNGTLRNLDGATRATDGPDARVDSGAGLGPATLIFPGPDVDTHSWLVDITGQMDPDDPESALLVYDSGVLHRPAPAALGEQAHC